MEKRVAIIVRSFYSKRIAALARVVLEIGLRLSKERVQVDIITNGSTYKKEKIKEINVIQLESSGTIKPFREMIECTKKSNYQQVHLHASLFGLALSYPYLKTIEGKKFAFLYTSKAKIRDFSKIKPFEFLLLWKRIFLRNFFYSLFLPNVLIKKSLNAFDKVFVPSMRIKTSISPYLKSPENIEVIYPGANNIYESEIPISKDTFFDDFLLKTEGKKVIIHSGLASPFRGMFETIEVFKHIYTKDQSFLMVFMVYSDQGENIPQLLIEKLKKKAARELQKNSYLIIDTPVKNINEYLKRAKAAFFNYRYIGDIPECPLTIIEIMGMGVPVFVNNFMAIPEYVNKELLVDTDEKDKLAKIIVDKINSDKPLVDLEEISKKFNWENIIKKLDL